MIAPADLADRCPVCGTERNAPPVEPHNEPKARDGMVTARYKCPDCKCKWLVSWDAASLGRAA